MSGLNVWRDLFKHQQALPSVDIIFFYKCHSLHLNVKKKVCMFFRKRNCKVSQEPDVYVAGKRLRVVSALKYLGIIIIDSNLFKKTCHKGLEI